MIKLASLLLLCLGALWWCVRDDIAEYAAFKLLTETTDRQKRFRAWLLKSFLVFSGATLVSLGILGRLPALTFFPPEFRKLSATLQSFLPKSQLPGPGFMVGFSCALLAGLIAGALLTKARARKTPRLVLGDIEPLMPRNGPETAWAAVLSLNAGLSEELFFRLLLPLLLTGLLGNAILAFSLAAIVFGMVHFYQGPVGIFATTIPGLALTVLYLWTGNLWIAVGAHACLDLLGLVVRPTIARLMKTAS